MKNIAPRKRYSRRHFLQMGAASSAAMLTSSLLSSCAVDPVTGEHEIVLMSPAEEIAIDKRQAPYQFSADYGVVQDSRLNSYINRVGMEIASRSHRPNMPYSFRAVNAAYINAYAMPGGSIAVTRGILVELNNEAELAALLGHEIGHVNARHAAETSTKGMFANLLLAGATIATSAAGYGSAAGLVQQLGGMSAGALLAHYSRDNEREADALGMEYMTRAGYTPRGMVELMEVLVQNGHRNPSAIELMFATHPMSSERLAWAKQAASTKYAQFLNTGAVNRERYMDQTARLRRIKPAIEAMGKASAALNKKKPQEADQLLVRALHIAPNDYAALVMRAKCKLAMKQAGEARRLAQAASRVYPQEAQAHLISGIASLVEKKYSPAYDAFSRYDQILPGNPEILFFRGLCQEHMQHRDQAARFYHAYLQKVRRGKNASYAYSRLKTWGYIR